jgi:hypothetical protein
MPKIIVRRSDSFVDGMRKFKVLVDGEVVGKVARKKQVEVEVEPGQHEVQMKLDWGKSEPMTVDASAGDVPLLCEPRGTTKQAKTSALLRGGKDYITLREDTPDSDDS